MIIVNVTFQQSIVMADIHFYIPRFCLKKRQNINIIIIMSFGNITALYKKINSQFA